MTETPTTRVEELERELEELREELATLQRDREPEPVGEYTLTRSSGESVTLASLFGDHDDLVVIHNMGRSCPYCTMWADGFEGLRPHLEDRAGFVVSTPDEPAVQRAFAESRDWSFEMVSTAGTTFAADLGFETPDGDPTPGVSTFHLTDDGDVVRVARRSFGPGDQFCASYHLFDLLPDGRDGWQPRFEYDD